MTLQRLLFTTSLSLLSVTLAATLALVLITHRTTVASEVLVKKMSRAQSLRALGRALSTHRRDTLLFSITHDAKYADEIRAQEAAIIAARNGLTQLSSDPEERQENERIGTEVRRYLDIASASTPQEADSVYDPVRETLFQLIEARLSSVFVLQSKVAATERDAQLFSLLVVALSALGTLVVMFSLRRRLVRPVATLLATIRAFQHRQQPTQAPPLSGELGTIQRALEDMIHTIEAQRVAQLTFVSGVAHDLRNPLTAMRIVSQALGPDRQPPSADKLKHVHATLESQIRRLDQQLGDLLDSTQVEAGELRLDPEDGDLVELIHQTTALLDSGARERIALELPERLLCRFDRVRIQQVLSNLLGNAIKYSKAGTSIVIQVQLRASEAIVTVRDHGIGIPPEDLRRLFTPFHRGRAADLRIPGTGLGLSVSRKIIVAHGGSVSVESEVGKGSVFHVVLPLLPVTPLPLPQAGPRG